MSQADVVSFLRPMLRKAWDAGAAMETEWLQHDADVVSANLRIPSFTGTKAIETTLPNQVMASAAPHPSNA